MLSGRQTWIFENKPVLLNTGTVGGPFEAQGPLKADFDMLYDDDMLNEASFEKAQQKFMEQACQIALNKSELTKEQINFFISGDLINQMTPTTFAAETLEIPHLGVLSACSTSAESLALSAAIINGGGADYIISGTSSHHGASERQFRYPNEYGSQKPPTAQWTVTGAGTALVAKDGDGPVITSATVGKITNLGITDPFNMGGAMAPAAVDTIMTHLKERNIDESYYDYIITGDLGKIGRQTSFDLLHSQGVYVTNKQYVDSGVMIYSEEQPVHAGASGPGCSAIVTYGHFYNQLVTGACKRILLVATGSLHSPISIQQGDSIPCTAHAVSIERRDAL